MTCKIGILSFQGSVNFISIKKASRKKNLKTTVIIHCIFTEKSVYILDTIIII